MTPERRKYLTRKAAEYRAKKKNLNVVPVLADPPSPPEIKLRVASVGGEARESTPSPKTDSKIHSRGGVQTFTWDKEKYPDKKAWEIAVVRVERARKYAEKFPQFVHASDLKYQDVEWQYLNEGIKSVKVPS